MCCTVTVWLVETIWERYPFSLIKHDGWRRVVSFFGIIAIALAMHFFFYFAQELTWGEAIRGTRRDFAPDWRWLHVGETAVFFLVHHWFMDNWPAWKMAPKTAAEIQRDHEARQAMVDDIRWTPGLGWGVGTGALVGVAVYFVAVWALPIFYNAITVIE
ncbi:uncharacterized protein Dvar_79970 [Desulfosarcina variabilis str. Montpellier]